MSYIMAVGNANLVASSPVFLDRTLLNLARKKQITHFGTGKVIAGSWYFKLSLVEKLEKFTFSTNRCLSIKALPDCMIIVNIEESEELRWALKRAKHKVELVLYDY